MGAIELEPRAGAPGKRAYEVFTKAFEAGVLIRVTGDTIALSPPLIVQKAQLDQILGCADKMLRSVG
jgi:beta-alanine--pyruvate transaminase